MIGEYFFENPEVFIIAIAVLLFLVIFSVIARRYDKGMSVLIALAISGIASWSLWRNDFYGWEEIIVYLMYAAVIAVLIRVIVWPFVKSFVKI